MGVIGGALAIALLGPPLVYQFVLEHRLDEDQQHQLVIAYLCWVCFLVGLLWGLVL